MLKCCRRMARLSHAPSTANLLAQYTSLKGRPAREQAVLAISSLAASINMYSFHPSIDKTASNTRGSHRGAPRCCRLPKCDPCTEPSCLAGKLGLSGWYRGDWPRALSSLTPKTAPPTVPSDPHQRCTLKAQRAVTFLHQLRFSPGTTGPYPERLFVSPRSAPSPLGWTAGWLHPFGVCPRCPCVGL